MFRKNKKLQHSYYKWHDDLYSEFMIQFLKYLEPRKYHEGELIYQELSEVLEITFIMTGAYQIGYEINKITKMKI